MSRRHKVQYLNVAVRCLGCRTPYIASQTVRYFYTGEGSFGGKEKNRSALCPQCGGYRKEKIKRGADPH